MIEEWEKWGCSFYPWKCNAFDGASMKCREFSWMCSKGERDCEGNAFKRRCTLRSVSNSLHTASVAFHLDAFYAFSIERNIKSKTLIANRRHITQPRCECILLRQKLCWHLEPSTLALCRRFFFWKMSENPTQKTCSSVIIFESMPIWNVFIFLPFFPFFNVSRSMKIETGKKI